jgi:hypothetical protein
MLALHDLARAHWLAIMEAEGGRETLDLATVEGDNVASAVKEFRIRSYHVVTITHNQTKVKFFLHYFALIKINLKGLDTLP